MKTGTNAGIIGALGLSALFFWIYANSGDAEAGEAVFSVDGETQNYGGEMSNGQLSQNGLDFIKAREGFSAYSYPDHKGRSIGYGHLIKPGESFEEPISGTVADSLLMNDVSWAVNVVNNSVNVPLTQNQFDALVSFAFNVGAGAFAKSTLVKRINNDDPQAVNEFARWVYASGKVLPALVARRELEVNLFQA